MGDTADRSASDETGDPGVRRSSGRARIWLGLAGVVLIAAMLLVRHLPAKMTASAPMGSTLQVTVDDDASLYSTHRYWDFDCTVTASSGRPVALRSDMLAQDLPGGWYHRGELVDAGRLTIACSSPKGGQFGVGPTRSLGFLLLQGALLVAGTGLLIAVVFLTFAKRARRRR